MGLDWTDDWAVVIGVCVRVRVVGFDDRCVSFCRDTMWSVWSATSVDDGATTIPACLCISRRSDRPGTGREPAETPSQREREREREREKEHKQIFVVEPHTLSASVDEGAASHFIHRCSCSIGSLK